MKYLETTRHTHQLVSLQVFQVLVRDAGRPHVTEGLTHKCGAQPCLLSFHMIPAKSGGSTNDLRFALF
jgi:hypothetical protein